MNPRVAFIFFCCIVFVSGTYPENTTPREDTERVDLENFENKQGKIKRYIRPYIFMTDEEKDQLFLQRLIMLHQRILKEKKERERFV